MSAAPPGTSCARRNALQRDAEQQREQHLRTDQGQGPLSLLHNKAFVVGGCFEQQLAQQAGSRLGGPTASHQCDHLSSVGLHCISYGHDGCLHQRRGQIEDCHRGQRCRQSLDWGSHLGESTSQTLYAGKQQAQQRRPATANVFRDCRPATCQPGALLDQLQQDTGMPKSKHRS